MNGNGERFVSAHCDISKCTYLHTYKTVDKRKISQQRILSPKAISIITANTADGMYNNRADANEPAFMAPSTDPAMYSMVRDPGHSTWEAELINPSGVRVVMTLRILCFCAVDVGSECAPEARHPPTAVSNGIRRSTGGTLCSSVLIAARHSTVCTRGMPVR